MPPRPPSSLPGDNTATTVLSAELAERLRVAGRDGAHRTLLVIEAEDRIDLVPLESEGELVVGRGPPSDVVIADRSLSRRHARFAHRDGQVWVEDLGSTNGTTVEGQAITCRVLHAGEVAWLGAVAVAVQGPLRRGVEKPSALVVHDAFTTTLEEETARARHFDRPVVLAMLDGGDVPSQPAADSVARIAAVLTPRLRPMDRIAHFGGATVEVVLPEIDEGGAAVLLREALGALFETTTVGFASFPRAATNAHELAAACARAYRAASPGQPAVAPAVGEAAAIPPDPIGVTQQAVVVSPALRAVYRLVERLASTQIPVLLQGETGTGKEVLARAIVAAGHRRDKPLITLNCGAIPQHLVESTLFGHEKGAFTGAHQLHKGVFEAADGGTVFLDEIGELPLSAQSALLRVLSDRRVLRVGSTREIGVDVRLVCATHRDLEAMVEEGSFRMDLLYRLNAMTLTLPPLRARPEEIRPLSARFVEQANADHGRSVKQIAEPALGRLEAYDFPGNVRELKNAIERAVVIAEGDIVELEHLPERIQRFGECAVGSGPPLGDDPPTDLKAQLTRYEAGLILRALQEAGGNQSEAARRLKIPRRTLVHKIDTLGIKKLGYGLRR